jgi:hypothetical protein
MWHLSLFCVALISLATGSLTTLRLAHITHARADADRSSNCASIAPRPANCCRLKLRAKHDLKPVAIGTRFPPRTTPHLHPG